MHFATNTAARFAILLAALAARLISFACRLDETDIEKEGVRLPGVEEGMDPQYPWRATHDPDSPAVDYINAINDHIFNGSKKKRGRKPFISATTCLRTALSWAYGGCRTIVRIDLDKCAAAGVAALDMGGALNELCWQGQTANFAARSREVILDKDIPADCVTVLEVGRESWWWHAAGSSGYQLQHRFCQLRAEVCAYSA